MHFNIKTSREKVHQRKIRPEIQKVQKLAFFLNSTTEIHENSSET